jgi:thiosulfate/3-mercaptopyruvate sulfurtransferase
VSFINNLQEVSLYTHLITAAQLAQSYLNPDWVLIDCRFDLANPDWGFQDYQRAHIPGAVYAHLDKDLSSPVTPHTGRHPLPSPQQFQHKLQEWGIQPASQVVVYDTTGGSYAGRLWWMMRFFNHPAVALLDGGFGKWVQSGYPTKDGIETRPPVTLEYTPSFQQDMLVDAQEVERIRQDPNYRLIDARAPERFRGEIEPIDPVAGHIPGAVNRFHGQNLQTDGTLKPVDQLRKEFLDILGETPPEQTVLYCGSGVTSCHHLIAMEAAGLPGAKLYIGSWSEWIRDPHRPRS